MRGIRPCLDWRGGRGEDRDRFSYAERFHYACTYTRGPGHETRAVVTYGKLLATLAQTREIRLSSVRRPRNSRQSPSAPAAHAFTTFSDTEVRRVIERERSARKVFANAVRVSRPRVWFHSPRPTVPVRTLFNSCSRCNMLAHHALL